MKSRKPPEASALINRRTVMKALAATFIGNALAPSHAHAQATQPPKSRIAGLDVWTRYSDRPHPVSYTGSEPVGSILVDFTRRRLYYVNARDQAISYVIAAPMRGMEPSARKYSVSKITEWPSWTPTPNLLAHTPELRAALARQGSGTIEGGEHNPMGAAALYMLDGNGKDDGFRIHGTNDPDTIGTQSSIGCIRLHNLDLMPAPNGYIDNDWPLFSLILERGKKVAITIYRNGELVPGIAGTSSAPAPRP